MTGGLSLMGRVRRWWRIRRWRPADHTDCMSFMGPCQFCREVIEHRRRPLPRARVVR